MTCDPSKQGITRNHVVESRNGSQAVVGERCMNFSHCSQDKYINLRGGNTWAWHGRFNIDYG